MAFLAPSLRPVIMAGPGRMWAFVISAQRAMRKGPAVYCFLTVSVGRRDKASSAFTILHDRNDWDACQNQNGGGAEFFFHVWGCAIPPISANLRSSKMMKCFLRAIERNPRTVRSPKSVMMSQWVLSMHMESPVSSARVSSSDVDVTSADKQRFVRFNAMRRRR